MRHDEPDEGERPGDADGRGGQQGAGQRDAGAAAGDPGAQAAGEVVAEGLVDGHEGVQPAAPFAVYSSLVVDPARFGDLEAFRAETAAMVAHVKTAAPGPDRSVLVAGEQEQLTKADRLRHGIPVPDATWEELAAAAAEVGIARAELAALAGIA